jgi:hypothetical protein
MASIVRELKSLPGAILAIVILLIATFAVLNFIQSKAPSPINTLAGWTFNHASGQAYSTPSAPAMNVSQASYSNNLGPMI